jgi:TIR domain-containing protein/tetratricopeptide repeat protein
VFTETQEYIILANFIGPIQDRRLLSRCDTTFLRVTPACDLNNRCRLVEWNWVRFRIRLTWLKFKHVAVNVEVSSTVAKSKHRSPGSKGIFLSYRRVEGSWANRLCRHLGNRFGNDLVFQDVDDIAGGEEWRDKIAAAIHDAEVILVVIGPHWLVDQNGRRRLDDPADVLRKEVVDALEQKKVVLPVLVGGASMPDSKDLPQDIAPLTDRNAIPVTDTNWNDDLGPLLDRLRSLLIPTRQREPLENIQLELYRLQQEFFAALEQQQGPATALDVAQRTLALLDRVSPLYPDDTYLQAVRGYTHKNLAIALPRFERYEEADSHLSVADQVFSTLREEFPKDPSAWDGKGSVEYMKGNLVEARRCFERALELKPDYQEARENLTALLQELDQDSSEK